MTVLTIDIGGIESTAALAKGNLQAHERHELPAPASKTPQALRAALQTLVAPLQGRTNRVAIASTGIIRERALLTLNSHNLGGLMHPPLTQALEQITNLPTLAVNDAQVAAWAECHVFGGEHCDLAFITVFTGVGGGVANGGELLTRIGGLAGHLGRTLANLHGLMCGCGRVGCVEAIVSGRGIATTAEGTLAGCNAKTIFSCVGQGDEQASWLIYRSVRTLTKLIADVKATIDCQIMMIDGSVGLAEKYLALVERYLTQEPLAYHVELLATHYRCDTGLLGAALLARGEW